MLASSGDRLVEAIGELLHDGFGFHIDPTDEFREDLKILDSENRALCLCEIKGVNKSVQREYINQADSHRERSGFADDFPTLLIVNVSMKGGRSIVERDQPIADEQVAHARSMNILIVRAIDLVRLLKLLNRGNLKLTTVVELFTSQSGWLKVTDSGWTVEDGTPKP